MTLQIYCKVDVGNFPKKKVWKRKMSDPNAPEANIEIWKVKRLIKSLEAARGNGTSMISLILPVGLVCRAQLSQGLKEGLEIAQGSNL